MAALCSAGNHIKEVFSSRVFTECPSGSAPWVIIDSGYECSE